MINPRSSSSISPLPISFFLVLFPFYPPWTFFLITIDLNFLLIEIYMCEISRQLVVLVVLFDCTLYKTSRTWLSHTQTGLIFFLLFFWFRTKVLQVRSVYALLDSVVFKIRSKARSSPPESGDLRGKTLVFNPNRSYSSVKWSFLTLSPSPFILHVLLFQFFSMIRYSLRSYASQS